MTCGASATISTSACPTRTARRPRGPHGSRRAARIGRTASAEKPAISASRGRPVRPTGEPDLGCKLGPAEKACEVLEVLKGSPAEKAGLKAGDVIRKFDGKAAATAAALLEELKKKRPGDEATLEVQRGAETVTLKITLGRKAGA